MGSAAANARTFLFCPGHRPDRFAKGLMSGSDLVIIDLEDAVSPLEKIRARENVRDWLAAGNTAVVRVNGPSTRWFEDDLEAVSRHAAAIMLPKAERPADVIRVLDSADEEVLVIPLIETAAGVLNVREVCDVRGVVRVAFGNLDFAAGLGVDPASRAALAAARSALVYASAEAGCASPIDGVTPRIGNDDDLRRDARYAREMGFGAKLCIHPTQIPVVADALAPTDEETRWANEIVSNAADSVTVHHGTMIDPPVLARARRLLEESSTEGLDG